MTASFMPGLELGAGYYREVVAPLLGDRAHSAAPLGYGSDVLGYDTASSTDHGRGPRPQVFVADEDVADVAALIEHGLPAEFSGWPTRFGWDAIAVRHQVTVTSVRDWPVRVLSSDRFVQACLAEISDDWLRVEPLVGSADQFADSTDVTSNAVTVRRLRHVYSSNPGGTLLAG